MDDFVSPLHRYRIRQLLHLCAEIPAVVPDGGELTSALLGKINPGLRQNHNPQAADGKYGKFEVGAKAEGWNSAKVSMAAEAFAAASIGDQELIPIAHCSAWSLGVRQDPKFVNIENAGGNGLPFQMGQSVQLAKQGSPWPELSSPILYPNLAEGEGGPVDGKSPDFIVAQDFCYEVYQVGWEKDKVYIWEENNADSIRFAWMTGRRFGLRRGNHAMELADNWVGRGNADQQCQRRRRRDYLRAGR